MDWTVICASVWVLVLVFSLAPTGTFGNYCKLEMGVMIPFAHKALPTLFWEWGWEGGEVGAGNVETV